MKNFEKIKTVFYISNVYDLTFFIRLIESNIKFKFEPLFIVHPTLSKKNKLINVLEKYNFNYHLIPFELEYSINPYKNIYNSFRLKRWILRLKLQKNILISLDKSLFISNFLLKNFFKSILIQQIENDMSGYKSFLKLNIYYNIINFLSLSRLMKYYYLDTPNRNIFRLKFFTYSKPNIIYQTRLKEAIPKFNLQSYQNLISLNKIVIFGSRYNSWSFIDYNAKIKIQKIYKEIYNQFNSYLFIYIPHPLELGEEIEEIKIIFEHNLIIENSQISSEYYLLNNRDIKFCFSIGSTSSVSAFDMGFNSKVFYKYLNFDENIMKTYDQIFFDMPEEFYIRSISDINKECINNTKEYLDDFENIINNLNNKNNE